MTTEDVLEALLNLLAFYFLSNGKLGEHQIVEALQKRWKK